MIIDGRAIAKRLQGTVAQDISESGRQLSLAVFVLTNDLATRKFIAIKQQVAKEIGVHMEVLALAPTLTTEDVVLRIKEVARRHNGIIVQFPLPPQIDRDAVRNAIPLSHDVDAISDGAVAAFLHAGEVLPPVVGALKVILDEHNVSLGGQKVVVVGEGALVGKPAALFAKREGAEVCVLNVKSKDIKERVREADILILGAGVPNLITPDMVREGVVILDAGTSEDGGKLKGDADPACAKKAALFTPVPGGIGPITVACIFKNLYLLARKAQ